jgi:hypothetical protein
MNISLPYLVAPQPANPFIPVYWNIGAPVGEDCTNDPADLLLVQFLLSLLLKRPAQESPFARKECGTEPGTDLEPLPPVVPSGRLDEPTLRALRNLYGGHRIPRPAATITPARGYWHNGELWLIVYLNAAVSQAYPDVFPRLDLIPACPPALAAVIRAGTAGNGTMGNGDLPPL